MKYTEKIEEYIKNINEISPYRILWKDADEGLRLAYADWVRAHLHPYCMGVKRIDAKRCVNHGKCSVETHGDDATAYSACCYAGVREYRRPVKHDGKLIGMIMVTGGRSRRKPIAGLEAEFDTLLLAWDEKKAKTLAEVAAAGIQSIIPLREFSGVTAPLNAAESAADAIVRQLRHSPRADWRVADMAYDHGLSESRIVHVIRERYGTSFQALRSEFVMKHASQLLRQGTLSQEAIATQLGFCNAAYFSQAFKRHTGQSPRAFRQSQRVEEA